MAVNHDFSSLSTFPSEMKKLQQMSDKLFNPMIRTARQTPDKTSEHITHSALNQSSTFSPECTEKTSFSNDTAFDRHSQPSDFGSNRSFEVISSDVPTHSPGSSNPLDYSTHSRISDSVGHSSTPQVSPAAKTRSNSTSLIGSFSSSSSPSPSLPDTCFGPGNPNLSHPGLRDVKTHSNPFVSSVNSSKLSTTFESSEAISRLSSEVGGKRRGRMKKEISDQNMNGGSQDVPNKKKSTDSVKQPIKKHTPTALSATPNTRTTASTAAYKYLTWREKDRRRRFREEWKHLWLVVPHGRYEVMCLVCHKVMTQRKLDTIKRHTVRRHVELLGMPETDRQNLFEQLVRQHNLLGALDSTQTSNTAPSRTNRKSAENTKSHLMNKPLNDLNVISLENHVSRMGNNRSAELPLWHPAHSNMINSLSKLTEDKPVFPEVRHKNFPTHDRIRNFTHNNAPTSHALLSPLQNLQPILTSEHSLPGSPSPRRTPSESPLKYNRFMRAPSSFQNDFTGVSTPNYHGASSFLQRLSDNASSNSSNLTPTNPLLRKTENPQIEHNKPPIPSSFSQIFDHLSSFRAKPCVSEANRSVDVDAHFKSSIGHQSTVFHSADTTENHKFLSPLSILSDKLGIRPDLFKTHTGTSNSAVGGSVLNPKPQKMVDDTSAGPTTPFIPPLFGSTYHAGLGTESMNLPKLGTIPDTPAAFALAAAATAQSLLRCPPNLLPPSFAAEFMNQMPSQWNPELTPMMMATWAAAMAASMPGTRSTNTVEAGENQRQTDSPCTGSNPRIPTSACVSQPTTRISSTQNSSSANRTFAFQHIPPIFPPSMTDFTSKPPEPSTTKRDLNRFTGNSNVPLPWDWKQRNTFPQIPKPTISHLPDSDTLKITSDIRKAFHSSFFPSEMPTNQNLKSNVPTSHFSEKRHLSRSPSDSLHERLSCLVCSWENKHRDFKIDKPEFYSSFLKKLPHSCRRTDGNLPLPFVDINGQNSPGATQPTFGESFRSTNQTAHGMIPFPKPANCDNPGDLANRTPPHLWPPYQRTPFVTPPQEDCTTKYKNDPFPHHSSSESFSSPKESQTPLPITNGAKGDLTSHNSRVTPESCSPQSGLTSKYKRQITFREDGDGSEFLPPNNKRPRTPMEPLNISEVQSLGPSADPVSMESVDTIVSPRNSPETSDENDTPVKNPPPSVSPFWSTSLSGPHTSPSSMETAHPAVSSCTHNYGGDGFMVHILRLAPGQELRKSLSHYVVSNQLTGAFIITCCGSLQKATLRLANLQERQFRGPFEIVSMVGTLASDGYPHLHIALADSNGQVVGGHVLGSCEIHTTAEIVLGVTGVESELVDQSTSDISEQKNDGVSEKKCRRDQMPTNGIRLVRKADPRTGFKELAIEHRTQRRHSH